MVEESMNVFTYGSLMFPVVWERVLPGGRRRSGRAVLGGYRRRRIRGEVYPALVPGSPEDAVEGVLYRGVTSDQLEALDRFEDEGTGYQRIEVTVRDLAGIPYPAWVYRYLGDARVEAADWDPVEFERDGLARFLATYCRARDPG